MKQFAFNQAEVFMLEVRTGETFKNRMFDIFTNTATELGFKVRVTGGVFLTHEIDGTQEDFLTIADLAKQLS